MTNFKSLENPEVLIEVLLRRIPDSEAFTLLTRPE
jgi:hypothetical protein